MLSEIKCDNVPSRVLSQWTKQGHNFLHAGAPAHTAGALFMLFFFFAPAAHPESLVHQWEQKTLFVRKDCTLA